MAEVILKIPRARKWNKCFFEFETSLLLCFATIIVPYFVVAEGMCRKGVFIGERVKKFYVVTKRV